MKIIAIYGGPRLNRNTDQMLKRYLENIDINKNTIERVDLKDLTISMCDACYYCAKNAKCKFNDDMNLIYKKLDEADIVILATPMFFNSVSSLTKVMIDRCQMYWSKKFLLKKQTLKKGKKGYFLLQLELSKRTKLYQVYL